MEKASARIALDEFSIGTGADFFSPEEIFFSLVPLIKITGLFSQNHLRKKNYHRSRFKKFLEQFPKEAKLNPKYKKGWKVAKIRFLCILSYVILFYYFGAMGIAKLNYSDEQMKAFSPLQSQSTKKDLLENLNASENYSDHLLTAMEQDMYQLNQLELEEFLAMLKELNASRRADPTAEHLSFRQWIDERAELFPDTSTLLSEVNKTPSPKLIKQLTKMAQEQFDAHFAQEDDEY